MDMPIFPSPPAAAEPRKPLPQIGEHSSPYVIVPWSLNRFAGQRIVMTTSFGMEGCVLIDMYSKALQEAGSKGPRGQGVKGSRIQGSNGSEYPGYSPSDPWTLEPSNPSSLEVIYLDTMFFFPETHALRDRMAAKYPNVHFVNRGTTLTPEQQAAQYGDELWKRDPDLCCKLRKVDPMVEAMKGVDVWLSALRRSQSATRAGLNIVEWDWKYQVVKVNPLATWDRKEVWEYVQKHDVPYNELHEKGYPTVGCTHCTKPVEGSTPGDYSRAGRWADKKKTECGLHGYGI